MKNVSEKSKGKLWSKKENERFQMAVNKFENDWKKVAMIVGTRNAKQC